MQNKTELAHERGIKDIIREFRSILGRGISPAPVSS